MTMRLNVPNSQNNLGQANDVFIRILWTQLLKISLKLYDLLTDYGAPLAHAFLQDFVCCDERGIEFDVEAKALGAVKLCLSLHSPLAYGAFAVS